jgi:ABC-type sugar transport system substrate-binding protein
VVVAAAVAPTGWKRVLARNAMPAAGTRNNNLDAFFI